MRILSTTLVLRSVIVAMAGVVSSGCMPDGILIMPVSANRALQEEVLYRESLFPAGKIAVINIDGILLNADKRSLLGPAEHPVALLLEQLDKARKDSTVKAVVLRINSPGGSVTASELMHHELMQFKKTGKPVVAMMMDMAASGGYYIACAADEIIACQSTVTGSIGVVMQLFEVTGTMQKLGVKADVIKSGSQKAAGSPFEALTPEQRDVFQQIITEMYTQFVDVVDAGRPELSRERVVELADGRIYTATQALEYGLIDHIGTMNDALAEAKERAGLATVKVVSYVRPHGYVPNYYAQPAAPSVQTQVNLLNVNAGGQLGYHQPPFMYLWMRP